MLRVGRSWHLSFGSGRFRSCRKSGPLRAPDSSRLAGLAEGRGLAGLGHHEDGEWIYNDKTSLTQDILSYATVADVLSNRRHQTIVLARIGDSEAERTGSDFPGTMAAISGGPEPLPVHRRLSVLGQLRSGGGNGSRYLLSALPTRSAGEWQDVLNATTQFLRPYVHELATAGLPVPAAIPEVEHFSEHIDDDAFAELAWPRASLPWRSWRETRSISPASGRRMAGRSSLPTSSRLRVSAT